MAHEAHMETPLVAPFSYSPLPTGDHIRLLDVTTEPGKLPSSLNSDKLFNTEDALVVQLYVGDLKNPPLYDALSYTWGNPLRVFDREQDWALSEAKYGSKVPILCNGKLLYIGYSLYEALQTFRSFKRRHSSMGITSKDLESPRLIPTRRFVRDRIWIDAVCIDQSNLQERSSQVKMMHLVYKKADSVLIWLGPQETTGAILAMSSLHEDPGLVTKTLHLSKRDRSGVYHAAGRLPIDESEWYSAVSLLQRRWFRRAWIIQEVAWARMAIICGSPLWLDWKAVVHFSDWTAKNAQYSNFWLTPWVKRSSTFFQPPSSGDLSVESANRVIRSIGNIHLEVRDDDPDPTGQRRKEEVKKSSLLELLVQFWDSECTDARDKVYSVLSLCQDQEVLRSVPVDYSEPVADIYTKTAKVLLRTMGDLDLLSYSVGNCQLGPLRLPTWVPDWSTKLDPMPIGHSEAAQGDASRIRLTPFCADGRNEKWSPPVWIGCRIGSLRGPNLIVGGKRVSSIKATATIDVNEPENIFNLLINDIPSIYSYFKPVPQQSVGSSTTSWAQSDETRFEAMWRTIVADTWKDCHPAPNEAGLALGRFLANELDKAASELVSRDKSHVGDLDAHLMSKLRRKKASLESILRALSKDEELSLHKYGSDSTDFERGALASSRLITRPRRYLPRIRLSDDISELISSMRVTNDPDVLEWSEYFRKPRSLFSTVDRKLGLGPTSARQGDQIWILNGAKVPFILRPISDEMFELVGACYVHGIMHGQEVGFVRGAALPFTVDNSDLSEVVLQ